MDMARPRSHSWAHRAKPVDDNQTFSSRYLNRRDLRVADDTAEKGQGDYSARGRYTPRIPPKSGY